MSRGAAAGGPPDGSCRAGSAPANGAFRSAACITADSFHASNFDSQACAQSALVHDQPSFRANFILPMLRCESRPEAEPRYCDSSQQPRSRCSLKANAHTGQRDMISYGPSLMREAKCRLHSLTQSSILRSRGRANLFTRSHRAAARLRSLLCLQSFSGRDSSTMEYLWGKTRSNQV